MIIPPSIRSRHFSLPAAVASRVRRVSGGWAVEATPTTAVRTPSESRPLAPRVWPTTGRRVLFNRWRPFLPRCIPPLPSSPPPERPLLWWAADPRAVRASSPLGPTGRTVRAGPLPSGGRGDGSVTCRHAPPLAPGPRPHTYGGSPYTALPAYTGPLPSHPPWKTRHAMGHADRLDTSDWGPLATARALSDSSASAAHTTHVDRGGALEVRCCAGQKCARPRHLPWQQVVRARPATPRTVPTVQVGFSPAAAE